MINHTRSIVVFGQDDPQVGAERSSPHPRYRFPRIEIEQRPLPNLADDCIRVLILYAGICGTDLHLLETTKDGYTRCSSPANIPPRGRVMGHEGVGRVYEIGRKVANLAVDDIVCFESIITCGLCAKCRQGSFNQCERAKLLGMERDGLFSELADVPAAIAHRVNDLAEGGESRLEALACVEPAAVAYLACANARIAPGETVAVLGAGPIGFFAALMARTLFGAASVTVSEPVEFRRGFVRPAADRVFRPDEFSRSRDSFDVLIDAAGSLSDTSAAIARMNGNGRIVLLSRTGEPLHIDLVDQVISKNLHIIGSRGHLGGAMGAVLALARGGRLDLRQPVTRVVVGLDRLFVSLQDPAGLLAGDCKVLARLS